jgi:hypothetical protein
LHETRACSNLHPLLEVTMQARAGEPIDERVPWISRLQALDEARATTLPGPRLEALRRAGRRLGETLRDEGRIRGCKTLDVATLPYPTRFAFNGVVPLPWPMVIMIHRTLLLQIETTAGLKNVLFNPTDAAAARATPFFAKLGERVRSVAPFAEKLLSKTFDPLEDRLLALGVAPEDVDVIAYDHFHTQDLRPVLGTPATPGRFPNALLLAPRREWEEWDGLHPLQRPWFVADGKQGVDTRRVVLTDGDLSLGTGCMLVRTPGHTVGNQTLFVHGDQGVFGCSENGTSADSWNPRESRIPGLKRHAEYYDAEVVLNSNTPELAAEQYTSMVLERSIVDAVPDRPEFAQMFPSSEVTPSALAPGLKPSLLFRHRDSGIHARMAA